MSWSGYIDLLGTRDAAKLDAQDLQIYLDHFHSALADFVDKFNGDCYAFSDGAFFSCESFDDFHPFFLRIRNQLFQQDAYFRCSYLPGAIRVDDGRQRKLKPRGIFVTYKFEGAAPEAYQAESLFKGVGCVVDIKKPRNESLRLELVQSSGDRKDQITSEIEKREEIFSRSRKNKLIDSFYIIQTGRKAAAIPSTDFRYSNYEIGDIDDLFDKDYTAQQRLVDPLISSCYSALARSSKIASYYISALVSMVRCSDLKKADWDISSGSWIYTPYVFRHLLSDHSLRLLRDVPGFHLLLLTCFDHLHRSKQVEGMTSALQGRVIQHLLKVSGCFRDLDSVPDFVISPAAKRTLIDLKLRDARADRRRPRKAEVSEKI